MNDGSFLIVLLLSQQLANFHLDQLDDFLIINHVALVQSDEDVRNAHLAGEKNVLTGLWHGAVGGGNNEDCAVHLSSTGDHVLDVVGVAGGVNVCVVALVGLVLDVRTVGRDTTLFLFRCLVDGIESKSLVQLRVCFSQNLGDGCGGGGLTVVNVTNGTDVNVRLGTLELRLCHCMSSWTSRWLRLSQPHWW